MARILDRAMERHVPSLNMFKEDQPLATQIQHVLEALGPVIAEHQIQVNVELTPRAAVLPTATLGPVILNGLRNALDACAGSNQSPRRIELSVAVKPKDQLIILICDNGSGVSEECWPGHSTKADGHGLGLGLCRSIVNALDGRMRLMNVPFGTGAILQVTVPVRRLLEHG